MGRGNIDIGYGIKKKINVKQMRKFEIILYTITYKTTI